MREKLQRFMMGRYGMDSLGQAIQIAVLVCLLLSIFGLPLFSTIGLLLIVFSMYRMFSRDLERRRAENNAYLRQKNKVVKWFHTRKKRFEQRGTYRYFSCPNCKQDLRVPKGQGTVTITCPKCATRFEKKS